MGSETKAPKRRETLREWGRSERGMSVPALFILALPMLLAAFGWGFDSMRLQYMKQWLIVRAEAAVAAGTTENYTGPINSVDSTVIIGEENPDGTTDVWPAYDKAWENYELNTENRRDEELLQCDLYGDLDPTELGTVPQPGQPYSPANPMRTPSGAEKLMKEYMIKTQPSCAMVFGIIGTPGGVLNPTTERQQLCAADADSTQYGMIVGVNEMLSPVFLTMFGVEAFELRAISGTSLVSSCL